MRSERNAAHPCGLQRGLRALADSLRFGLGNGSEYVQQQTVRVRYVGRSELNFAIQHSSDKANRALRWIHFIFPKLRRMVIPELKDLDMGSADGPETLAYVEGESFEVHLTATVGPVDEPGGDLFQIAVGSPERLREMAEEGSRFLRHYLLVPRYDFPAVKQQIEKLCHSCPGPDWHTAAAKLSRYMRSEFEDYNGEVWPK
jgi:Immunity protein 8